MLYHLDTDFLIYAVGAAGTERRLLLKLADSEHVLRLSAIAWYEYARGPRTTEQLTVARAFFGTDGIVPFAEDLAARAADIFRRLGSPRRRAADIAIGVTAASCEAILLTRNRRDFAGIPALKMVPGVEI